MGAEAIRKDGGAISFSNHWRGANVDIVELLLRLGVPVELGPHAAGRQERAFGLALWAETATRPGWGADPERILGDEFMGPLLRIAVGALFGNAAFDNAVKGKPAIAKAREEWLSAKIDELEAQGLPATGDALTSIREKASSATFAEFPDLHAKLDAVRIAKSLATTLRGGIPGEVGWPALDEVWDEFPLAVVSGTFPFLVVHDQLRAVVIGPKGRIMEHDFVLKKQASAGNAKASVSRVRYSGGQLLVQYRQGYKEYAYWSEAPTDTFEGPPTWGPSGPTAGVQLDDGLVTDGGVPLRPGDRRLAANGFVRFFSDGTTFWRSHFDGVKAEMREFDPRTGKLARASLPTFFESQIQEGQRLSEHDSWLLPAPPPRSERRGQCRPGWRHWDVRDLERHGGHRLSRPSGQ